ncbi:hypothetical protein EF912_31360 [Streptomyces sp. WAC07061]|uniref:hypothetical protein n=1 Tax=Streptomyces sp. WAC07061 TaxID=2487410 RepID=UPI000F77DA20|nr:hypothetical protein [Streptomyces sp. WAC07061]RSS41590.1 hypothetical protein EF912_31360 [Streptomyces sp. WAC07061]
MTAHEAAVVKEQTIVIATAERVLAPGFGTDRLIWHVPAGGLVEDFQALACSDQEGLSAPGGPRDVPVDLDVPGQSWCPRCLMLARAK